MNEDAQDEYLSFIVLVFIIYLLKRLVNLWNFCECLENLP